MIVKYATETCIITVLQCLIILFDTQNLSEIKPKVIKKLENIQTFKTSLQYIQSKYYPNIKNFTGIVEGEKITGEKFISYLLYEAGLIKSTDSQMIFTSLNPDNTLLNALDNLFLSLEKYRKIDLENLFIIKSNLFTSVLSNPSDNFEDITILSPLFSFLFNLIYVKGNHTSIKNIISEFINNFQISLLQNINIGDNVYDNIFKGMVSNIIEKPELYSQLLYSCNMQSSNMIILIITYYILKSDNNISIRSNESYDFYYIFYQLINYQLEHITVTDNIKINNNFKQFTNYSDPSEQISFILICVLELINSITKSIDYEGKISVRDVIILLLSVNNNLYHVYEESIQKILNEFTQDRILILDSIIINPTSNATPQAQYRAYQLFYYFVKAEGEISLIIPISFISLCHSSKHIRNYAFDILMSIKDDLKQDKETKFIVDFLSLLKSNKEEIINSNQGINNICKNILNDGNQDNKVSNIDNFINYIFNSLSDNNYLRISYLCKIFDHCSIHESIFDILINILNRIIKDEEIKDNSESLSDEEIICLRFIFNYSFKSMLISNDVFSLYVSMLKSVDDKPGIVPVVSIFLEYFSANFYNSLQAAQKTALFESLCVLTRHSDLISQQLLSPILSEIKLDLNYIESLFTQLDSIPEDGLNDWLNKTITYCEVSRINNELKEYTPILSHLFKYLELLLPIMSNNNEENNAMVEYTLQIILENILNFAVQLTEKDITEVKRRKTIKDTRVFNIDILLQYLQESVNPQARNTVLLIIGTLVRGKYDKILKDLYPTLNKMIKLNLQKDIEINYHILLQLLRMISSVIQSKNMTVDYLHLFISNYDIYPETRRLPFFKSLVTIFTMSNLYWTQFLFYIDIHNNQITDNKKESIEQFLHSLTSSFPPLYQISNLSRLLSITYELLLLYYPNLKDNSNETNENQLEIPDTLKTNYLNSINTVSFITDLLHFVSKHMTTDSFLQQIIGNNEIETNQIEKGYLHICEVLFMLIRCIANQCSLPSSSEYQSFLPILNACYDIIDTINELLSIPSFIVVITELLNNSHSIVRKKALLFFNKKIESEENTMSPQEQKLFLEMLPELSKVIKNNDEEIINRQTAILSIHILAEHFANQYNDEFIPSLSTIIEIIKSDLSNNTKQLLGSSYICLATLCKALGAKIFPYLSQFFPSLLNLIKHFITVKEEPLSESSLLLIQSILSSLSSIITNIPSFLSPYIKEILTYTLDPYFICNNEIINYAKLILKLVGHNVAVRILNPILEEIYPIISNFNNYNCQINLLYLLQKLIEKFTREDVVYYHKPIFEYLLNFMNYRTATNSDSNTTFEVERATISTMIIFILKLSESQLRPLFLRLCEWIKGDGSNEEITYKKGIVFFYLVDETTNKLRSIFVPYFGYIINDIVNLLDKLYQTRKQLDNNNYILLKQIIKCLYSCALYDQDKFIDGKKFEVLRTPVLQLLQITTVPNDNENNYDDYINNYVIPCISQLVLDINDDILWKPFHHEVFLFIF